MATTYEKIATTTLGSGSSSLTFSSIPGTYTDLRLVLVGTSATSPVGGPYARLNGDTGNNYSNTYMYGYGSGVGSGQRTSYNQIDLEYFNVFSTTIPEMKTLDFFSYAGSTYKTILETDSSDQNGSGWTANAVFLWSSTAAITSISIYQNSSNFGVGTTATLYGIKAA
jgi:hypothetical protein